MVRQSVQHRAGAPRVRALRLDVWFERSLRDNGTGGTSYHECKNSKQLHHEDIIPSKPDFDLGGKRLNGNIRRCQRPRGDPSRAS